MNVGNRLYFVSTNYSSIYMPGLCKDIKILILELTPRLPSNRKIYITCMSMSWLLTLTQQLAYIRITLAVFALRT